jgi:methoxymalonate biosynthesis acyl carrier protein
MDEIRVKVRGFLSRYTHSHLLGDDTDIFSAGFVNSLLAMQLVTYLESEFEVTIDNDDLEINNFRTIHAISELVTRKICSPAME